MSFYTFVSFVVVLLCCVASASASTSTTTTVLDTLWVLSPESGSPTSPNSQNLPLFGNASVFISSSSSKVQFCFATGYEFEFPLLSENQNQKMWPEPTHLFFQNMFMGLEYQVGKLASTDYTNISTPSSVSISLTRPMSSSQTQGLARELMTFTLANNEHEQQKESQQQQLHLDWSRIFTWNPNKTEPHATKWIFDKATSSSGNINIFGCNFTSSKLIHHHPARSDLLTQFTQLQKEKERASSFLNSEQNKHNFDDDKVKKTTRKDHITHQRYLSGKTKAESLTQHPFDQMKQRQLSQDETSFVLFINATWNITAGGLDHNAFLLALQGIVNRNRAVLYIIYPTSWEWTDTYSIFDYYNETGADVGLRFVTLRNFDDVLDVFSNRIPTNSVVTWTRKCRESLLAGWSMAGIHDALLIEENDKELFSAINSRRASQQQQQQLEIVERLSAPFYTDMSMNRTIASEWLYSQIWPRVSKQYIVSIGGVQGEMIEPGVADFAVQQKAFVHDLSTSQENNPDQYNLIKKLLSQMDTNGELAKTGNVLWVGWHQYGLDLEHTQTTLVSSQKMAVEGLNTQPNFSFNHKVPVPADWKFRPNKMIAPSSPKENSIYASLIQSDGIGLGAWRLPGRGLVQYNWEVTLCDLYLQPAVVRYLYLNSTQNDFFVGALGGLGYAYPKAIPADFLFYALNKTQTAMTTLGLNTQIIFDASACSGEYTTTGDTNLNQTLVDDYCRIMSESSFVNGYTNAASWSVCPKTSSQHQRQPLHQLNEIPNQKQQQLQQQQQQVKQRRNGPGSFISFDYYVDMSRNVGSIVNDLLQLLAANPIRPYYIALHVREWNTEQRMEKLIEQLKQVLKNNTVTADTNFELVTADVLTELAGKFPTFRQHFSW